MSEYLAREQWWLEPGALDGALLYVALGGIASPANAGQEEPPAYEEDELKNSPPTKDEA